MDCPTCGAPARPDGPDADMCSSGGPLLPAESLSNPAGTFGDSLGLSAEGGSAEATKLAAVELSGIPLMSSTCQKALVCCLCSLTVPGSP